MRYDRAVKAWTGKPTAWSPRLLADAARQACFARVGRCRASVSIISADHDGSRAPPPDMSREHWDESRPRSIRRSMTRRWRLRGSTGVVVLAFHLAGDAPSCRYGDPVRNGPRPDCLRIAPALRRSGRCRLATAGRCTVDRDRPTDVPIAIQRSRESGDVALRQVELAPVSVPTEPYRLHRRGPIEVVHQRFNHCLRHRLPFDQVSGGDATGMRGAALPAKEDTARPIIGGLLGHANVPEESAI